MKNFSQEYLTQKILSRQSGQNRFVENKIKESMFSFALVFPKKSSVDSLFYLKLLGEHDLFEHDRIFNHYNIDPDLYWRFFVFVDKDFKKQIYGYSQDAILSDLVLIERCFYLPNTEYSSIISSIEKYLVASSFKVNSVYYSLEII